MYKRSLQTIIKKRASQYPIVTVIGPRQSGKTTLVKNTFPEKPYVNLESLDTRQFAIDDPRGFLNLYPEGAIFDEIQRAPTLLSYIQPLVDEIEFNGMFILTGSHQVELQQSISQSLAGRTSLLSLLPLSLQELNEANIQLSLSEAIFKGGYPRVYKSHLEPTVAYSDYYQTYIERDLRQIVHVKDLTTFDKFVRLLAGRAGQILNMESLANETGTSAPTIKHWISILEASYIIIRLQPYFENFGKRVIKSPKVYFTDVGLLSFLLGIETIQQLERDPLRGHLFENLVFLELLKNRYNEGKIPNLFYFRDNGGHEIDFIFQTGHELVPIEVKSSSTYHSDFLKNLYFFQELVKERSPKGYLIYSGSHEQTVGPFSVLNYNNSYKVMHTGHNLSD